MLAADLSSLSNMYTTLHYGKSSLLFRPSANLGTRGQPHAALTADARFQRHQTYPGAARGAPSTVVSAVYEGGIGKRKRQLHQYTPRSSARTILHGAVAASAPAPLHQPDDAPHPVLEQVRYVADGVAVREQVPPPRPVAVVVEPRAEDEVRRRAQEHAVSDQPLSARRTYARLVWDKTHSTTNQVKNPHEALVCPPLSPSSSPAFASHACLVRHVRRSSLASLP